MPVTNLQPHASHITNEKIQGTIYDPKEIFNVLLRQNFRHLQKSQESIFTTGKLAERIDDDMESEVIEQILTGMDMTKDTTTMHSEYDYTLEHFIKSMKRATDHAGNEIKVYKWNFGVEEYKEVFGKTKETTACGPSGLHMSHWKAALENNIIMEIHAFFIWAAFQFGFSYERWETSWHCMLLKKKTPLCTKITNHPTI